MWFLPSLLNFWTKIHFAFPVFYTTSTTEFSETDRTVLYCHWFQWIIILYQYEIMGCHCAESVGIWFFYLMHPLGLSMSSDTRNIFFKRAENRAMVAPEGRTCRETGSHVFVREPRGWLGLRATSQLPSFQRMTCCTSTSRHMLKGLGFMPLWAGNEILFFQVWKLRVARLYFAVAAGG
jgi:hypothetical protein